MSDLIRRDQMSEPASWFEQMDRMFDEWFRLAPMRRAFAADWGRPGAEVIRVDEYLDNDAQVIRAELPGIDPAKDVELTVTDGMLRIAAERRTEEKSADKGYRRHELRYGSYARVLPLPEGVVEDDITATYKDGILEVRVPIPKQPAGRAPKRIEISSS
jgi:HSP20 family protein